ncbi:MAG: peptidylprolyl isomerase [Fimbriimonadaceae bacterium]|nr:peptidylprolyl isomerase [Fimbriimonadaceae bacterium]QYK55745.1 MAG: peptidylprolyl isomerase [Fimbriimonadaceae bacterium]
MKFILRLLFLLVVPLAVAAGSRPVADSQLVLTVQGKGQIVIQLADEKAPKTVAQVTRLVGQKFYDGQRFHKVVKEPKPFLIQIGDPGSRTKDMDDPSLGSGRSGQTVPFENSGLPNVEGAVGLAALPNDRNSGDSQFYILLGPARFLDGSYTVFGNVVRGMDVVRKIELGDKVTSATIVRG